MNTPTSPLEHHCTTLVHPRPPEIQVLHGTSVDEFWKHWLLRVYHYATAKDVYDGEAEMVGDLMHDTSFAIYFCPFCGAKLPPGGE